MRRYFRHYRVPNFYRGGFRQRAPGFEARGGVTLCVEEEVSNEPVSPTARSRLLRLRVGVAVCSQKDNYSRAEGRALSAARLQSREAATMLFNPFRFPHYTEAATLYEVNRENWLGNLATQAATAVYGSAFIQLTGNPIKKKRPIQTTIAPPNAWHKPTTEDVS